MSGAEKTIRFLLDEGVPNSVGLVMERAGHEVHYVNRSQVVLRGSPDLVVAQGAILKKSVLVALDGDMQKIAQSHGVGKNRYSKLSLLKLTCFEPNAAERVETMMSLIEHEWDVGGTGGTRKFHVEIKDTLVRSLR